MNGLVEVSKIGHCFIFAVRVVDRVELVGVAIISDYIIWMGNFFVDVFLLIRIMTVDKKNFVDGCTSEVRVTITFTMKFTKTVVAEGKLSVLWSYFYINLWKIITLSLFDFCQLTWVKQWFSSGAG